MLPRHASSCLIMPHYVSFCLIMFPFIYHVPSCYLYNITLPTVARDPLTVELTMLSLLDHDARGATGEGDLEVEVKVAQERLVVPELPAFLHSNGKRKGILVYTVIWPGCLRLLGVRACGRHLHGRFLCRGGGNPTPLSWSWRRTLAACLPAPTWQWWPSRPKGGRRATHSRPCGCRQTSSSEGGEWGARWNFRSVTSDPWKDTARVSQPASQSVSQSEEDKSRHSRARVKKKSRTVVFLKGLWLWNPWCPTALQVLLNSSRSRCIFSSANFEKRAHVRLLSCDIYWLVLRNRSWIS